MLQCLRADDFPSIQNNPKRKAQSPEKKSSKIHWKNSGCRPTHIFLPPKVWVEEESLFLNLVLIWFLVSSNLSSYHSFSCFFSSPQFSGVIFFSNLFTQRHFFPSQEMTPIQWRKGEKGPFFAKLHPAFKEKAQDPSLPVLSFFSQAPARPPFSSTAGSRCSPHLQQASRLTTASWWMWSYPGNRFMPRCTYRPLPQNDSATPRLTKQNIQLQIKRYIFWYNFNLLPTVCVSATAI